MDLDVSTPAHKVADVEEDLGWIYGRWQDYLSTDQHKQVWNIEQTNATKQSRFQSTKVISIPNSLPSDCRYREDITWLRRGEQNHAAQWK